MNYYTAAQAEADWGFNRQMVITIFKTLHARGVGIYKKGSRGWPTRLEKVG